MWWIALYLPRWPIEAWGPAAPDAVEEDGCIICLNEAADQAGVRLGMSVPAAEIRRPGLKIRPRQRDQEAQALRALAMAALRFSPQLCLRPDGFLLEVQASLRLFGGPLRLWRQLQQTIESFKVSTHLAAAPFPEAAWLLAQVRGPWRQQVRAGPRATVGPSLGVGQSRDPQAVRPVLDALPVQAVLQAWGAPVATQELLQGLGVSTLGECRALPRAGLLRRIDSAFVLQIDRAYGQVPDPRPVWAPPPNFDERLSLPERSTDAECINQALQQLLQGLEGWLTAQGRLAQVLVLHLLHEARRHEPLPDTLHTLRLAAPERQATELQHLWAERLKRAPLVSPVVGLRLVLQASEMPQTQEMQRALGMASVQQATAPDTHEARQALARLLDRLQARLGPEAVQGLSCENEHRPERASRMVPLQSDAPTPMGTAPRPGPKARLDMWPKARSDTRPQDRSDIRPQDRPHTGPQDRRHTEPHGRVHSRPQPLPRPLWLLPTPEPLAEHQGQPLHRGAPLLLRTRPERIEAGWFDGDPVCRDYQVAEASNQRLCWVFRERRGSEQGWYLHGWFT